MKNVDLSEFKHTGIVVYGNHTQPVGDAFFHSLRHTFATRALEYGMDIKTLSEILGHKSATVTMNRYAHSLMEHKTEMMNKLGKFLQ